MKVKIKGPFRDILSFIIHIKKRNRIFKKAPSVPVKTGKMNILAEQLHPLSQEFIIDSIISETKDTNTYRLKGLGRKPAFFLPGQYISINFKIGESTLARPFSISSSPEEALKGGYYDVTVKSSDNGGFTDNWIKSNWKPGFKVVSSGPAGMFTWERLRDSNLLVCIAGGSGITPFKPIIRSVLLKSPSSKVLLFQGGRNEEDLIFRNFWQDTKNIHADKFFYIPVLTDPGKEWKGEHGFITSKLMLRSMKSALGKISVDDCSYFICGPEGLHTFIDEELSDLKIPRKRIRRELYALNSRTGKGGVYTLTVRQNGVEKTIEADKNETVLVALERGGFNPPSLCRSGECGWCRSKLISGSVTGHSRPGLRKADEKFGYIHPCSVFPDGNLIIELPSNPIKRSK